MDHHDLAGFSQKGGLAGDWKEGGKREDQGEDGEGDRETHSPALSEGLLQVELFLGPSLAEGLSLSVTQPLPPHSPISSKVTPPPARLPPGFMHLPTLSKPVPLLKLSSNHQSCCTCFLSGPRRMQRCGVGGRPAWEAALSRSQHRSASHTPHPMWA